MPTEEDLRRKYDLLRAVADETSDAVFVKDEGGKYLFFNRAAASLTGRPAAEVLGRDDTAVFEAGSARAVMADDRQVLATGTPRTYVEDLTAGGVTRTFQTTKAPYRDEHGNIVGVIGIARDITEQRRAEEESRLVAERLQTVIATAPLAIWALDRNGIKTLSVGKLLEKWGRKQNEMVGRSIFEAAKGVPEMLDAARRVLDGETLSGVTTSGAETFEWWYYPLRAGNGDLTGAIGVAIDASARKRAEEALREREELQRLLTENANDLIRLHTGAGVTIYSSPSVARRYGRVPTTLFEFAHPDDLESCERWWARVPAGEAEPLYWRDRSADGAWRWLELRGSIVPYHARPHIMTVCRDVTEQKEAEDARARSERLLRQVLDSLPVGVAVTDLFGDVILSNPASRRIWGGMITAGAERYVESKAWWHGTGKRVRPDDWPSKRAFLLGETSVNQLIDIEAFDGVRKTIKNSSAPIRDDDQVIAGAVVINEDVTDVLRLEAQFRQVQKMEAVGHLAGGVAHDFNNLLTVISVCSELLAKKFAPDDPARELVIQIREAGDMAAALTRQLLAFSRRTVLEPKVLDLNDVVRENEEMLRRLIGEDVHLSAVLDPVLPPVKVDRGQIGQVIINLVVNARDAMPTGGKLTIQTAKVAWDDSLAAAHPDAIPGNYVLLVVTDTGCGMTPEVRAHLFEPFFTTKEPGKGTGLGLATVYGIVKQSGGFIHVRTEPERGAAFQLFFPTADEISQTIRPVAKPAAGGSETILVVEDEDPVRSSVLRVLRQSGYTVLEARRGADAVRLWEQHAEPIHLLITDVVMPEMGGRELVERLTAVRGDLKVLYLSGYTADAVVRHGVLESEVSFLQKPFTATALAEKVRQVLDETHRP